MPAEPNTECPFPGMDPFLESQSWRDFHNTFITDIRDSLRGQLTYDYVVSVEERVLLKTSEQLEEERRSFVADGAVRERPGAESTAGSGALAVAEPQTAYTLLTLPDMEGDVQPYVEVRDAMTNQLVTVVELLSPANKVGDGRDDYLSKRIALLRSPIHLVELDFLRGGRRLPMTAPLPPGDFYAIVSDAGDRPQAEVHHWFLPNDLPTVRVPLRSFEKYATLRLGGLFRDRHARSGYRHTLDYGSPVSPRLPPDQAVWVADRLAAAGLP